MNTKIINPAIISNITNLRSRVSKLYIPKTKAMLPLFEVLSNSIHAIFEKKEIDHNFEGKIEINLVRVGAIETLKETENNDKYPIKSIEVIDNGIGLNDENFISFKEFDSEKKAKIGGKGIGRLVCLKLFSKLVVKSIYQEGDEFYVRNFEYKRTSKEGFDKYQNELTNKTSSKTTVLLDGFEEEYQKKAPKDILEIARQIITHFQLYFIEKIIPEIRITNQNGEEINLTNLFNTEFESEILDDTFVIGGYEFKVYITKSYNSLSHKILYCAHERTVKDEGLSKYIEDLRYMIKENDSILGYHYQVFVLSKFLDERVNEERTNFHFSEDDNEDNDTDEITLANIRRNTLNKVEELLSVFLSKTRKEKVEQYIPIIQREFPNYSSVIEFNREKVEKIPAGLTSKELDIKLYEIESEWKIEVKKDAIKLLDEKKDITSLVDYNVLYDKFWSEFNEVGKTDLARYVIHRRSVIDLLEKLIKWDSNQEFYNEDILHSLFFPIKEEKGTVVHEKQNLWLLDERLTFNSLLASDKTFKQITELESKSGDRMDLIIRQEEIFDKATLFSEDKFPYESFTIVEFKRPYRNDYVFGDPKKDPVRQVRKYINEIIDKKIKKDGRSIEASKSSPFYCYIVADITSSLEYILREEMFNKMPDGIGYFRFYTSDELPYKAYVEVIPFKKVIKNAKERNKILFDKLNIT
ncbi:ATP-binding protein [Flavobacterium sp. xlx-214]|uniref:ATP-binding protein n=1 Tax=unclassified Flavobacterium TaxID=196869 RepID=UPI0013CF6336|nr:MULTISPECIES: ATP-binding protein [unclassified Flavobacterium]MBA5791556.1 ATP-binding protein [Flavobacterium sp. xlx-221]QMI82807.1 ATP-binding protein [Flavobacterium sp. xlx-214]